MFAPISWVHAYVSKLKNVNNYACRCTLDKRYQWVFTKREAFQCKNQLICITNRFGFFSLMDFSDSTVIFCSFLTFVHVYKQCHLLFVVVVYVCFRSCLQIMLRALLLLYWPLMYKTLNICMCICRHLSIPANSVKTESVFQIICLYETTIFNLYVYISVILFSQSKDGWYI
jgi:hypothetical protein